MNALEQFDIKGRTALVTGAASGIGLAYAEAMVESGVAVTLTDVDTENLEREADRLRRSGADIRAAKVDVSDLDQVAAAFEDHVDAFGGLDIAFANAGIGDGEGFWNPEGFRNPKGQIDTLDPDDWHKMMSINLNGAFFTIREAARHMKANEAKGRRRGGSIVATSSNAAVICEAIVPMAYMPAKAGVMHMVHHTAMELAEFGIRVNAIAPGPFVTNIGGGWVKKDPEIRKTWDAMVPLGRVAETDQIKPLALYLASDASNYMTGGHLMIDGGMSLGKFK